MKNLGPWLKANLVWVIAVTVALLALPVALFFSFSMNAKIRKTVGDEVSAAVSKLQGIKVDYALPAVVPGQQAWALPKTEPNEPTTRAVVELLQKLSTESAEVRTLAVDRNKQGKSPLVEGLFPQPANESARVRLLTELVTARRQAGERLLESAGAGEPPAPDRLLTMLQAARDQEEQAIKRGRVDQKLSDDEEKEITDRLTAKRLEYYHSHAAGLRFYAGPSVFTSASTASDTGSGGRGGAGGPGAGGPGAGASASGGGLPTLEEAWRWQMEHWVYQDVLAAIVKANTGPNGLRLSPPDAPIKRLLRLSVSDPTDSGAPSSASQGGADQPSSAAGGDERTEYTRDYSASHTGRPFRTAVYDTLHAELEVLCDSARLPVIINAINTTNFMCVIALSFESVEPTRDLAQGYTYGNDHLVHAKLKIETIWLRSWIKPLMPRDVRKKLAIPDDAPEPAPGEPHTQS